MPRSLGAACPGRVLVLPASDACPPRGLNSGCCRMVRARYFDARSMRKDLGSTHPSLQSPCASGVLWRRRRAAKTPDPASTYRDAPQVTGGNTTRFGSNLRVPGCLGRISTRTR